MGWLWSERRAGRGSWLEECLSSVVALPSQLLAVIGIALLLFFISAYTSYKTQMEKTGFKLKIFMCILPALLIFLANYFSKLGGRLPWLSPATKARVANTGSREGGSPLGVALFLGILLILIFLRSSVSSMWWPFGPSY